MAVEDTYENRALFLMMWYGVPVWETEKMFPKWTNERFSIPLGKAQSMWLRNFTREALKMKKDN